MRDIPFNARVECTDGPVGKSTAVIINPIEQRVTHVVVKGDKMPWSKNRLVPVEQVEESSPALIRLNCSRDELADMEPFVAKRYVQKEPRDYPSAFYAGEGSAYRAS